MSRVNFICPCLSENETVRRFNRPNRNDNTAKEYLIFNFARNSLTSAQFLLVIERLSSQRRILIYDNVENRTLNSRHHTEFKSLEVTFHEIRGRISVDNFSVNQNH